MRVVAGALRGWLGSSGVGMFLPEAWRAGGVWQSAATRGGGRGVGRDAQRCRQGAWLRPSARGLAPTVAADLSGLRSRALAWRPILVARSQVWLRRVRRPPTPGRRQCCSLWQHGGLGGRFVAMLARYHGRGGLGAVGARRYQAWAWGTALPTWSHSGPVFGSRSGVDASAPQAESGTVMDAVTAQRCPTRPGVSPVLQHASGDVGANGSTRGAPPPRPRADPAMGPTTPLRSSRRCALGPGMITAARRPHWFDALAGWRRAVAGQSRCRRGSRSALVRVRRRRVLHGVRGARSSRPYVRRRSPGTGGRREWWVAVASEGAPRDLPARR